uniref:Uncharacterized protein n=2 Tax=Oryza meridionalis TaxID=40149 RepID=A0A0E0D624_9ORYZ
MCPHCPLWASLRCIIALTVQKGKIEKALLVAVGRDVLIYKESCVAPLVTMSNPQPTTIYFIRYPLFYELRLWASLHCIIASTVQRGQDRRGATSRGWSRCARLQRIVRRYVLVDMLTDLTEICLGEYVVCGALGLLELLLRRCVGEYMVPLHFSLISIGDDEQPTTIEINYFFYKVCLGGYAFRPYGDMSWCICGLRCFGVAGVALTEIVSVNMWFEVLWGSWSCSSN